MTMKTMLMLAVAAMLLTASGCKKEETDASADTPPPPPAAGDTPAAAQPAGGDVTTYPDTIPESGTRQVKMANVTVYQATDTTSKVLTRLAAGTLINLKGRRGNWLLIDWPCGVAQLCPGWIEATVNDARFAAATASPTATAAATAEPTATATAEPTATAVASTSATATSTATAGPRGKLDISKLPQPKKP